jgi:glycosyltransferase involved in cell wall biosynthesis
MILSFGLVGPGKGYERAIEAMAAVRDGVPDALYVVLGATHPDLLRSQGETYRTSLKTLVRDLGLEGAVRFEDRFVGPVELDAWLAAADVFVTPYPNLEQIVSGTLAYALGAGRAVVATPYSYAVEMLGAGGGGILVTPGSTASLAGSLTSVLEDPAYQADLEARALATGDRMRWSEVGARYRQLFREVSPSRDRDAAPSATPEVVGA